jgi:hypothetical protein
MCSREFAPESCIFSKSWAGHTRLHHICVGLGLICAMLPCCILKHDDLSAYRTLCICVLSGLYALQGQRALDFVLRNQGLIDKTLLFDIELVKVS